MVAPHQLSAQLKRILHDDLPGFQAQTEMMPEGRVKLTQYTDLDQAAVLIALYPQDGQFCFPLIRRVTDQYAHSGQVGLPGGRFEDNESAEEAALREAWEEIGIPTSTVRVCGHLSPLPIPVSGYLVNPVVGVLEAEPEWCIQEREVAALLNVPVQELLAPENIQAEVRRFSGRSWSIPYFNLAEQKVWGATAMILAEFRRILDRLERDVLTML